MKLDELYYGQSSKNSVFFTLRFSELFFKQKNENLGFSLSELHILALFLNFPPENPGLMSYARCKISQKYQNNMSENR